MTAWHWTQRDFSGGEISPRMLMRADTELYQKSVLEMENWQPTIQGTARRMPGSRYLRTLDDLNTRLIPFLTTGNERSLILLGPLTAKLLTNVTDEIAPGRVVQSTSVSVNGPETLATVIYREPLIDDENFENGADSWVLDPEGPLTGRNGDPGLGVWYQRPTRSVVMSPRWYKWPNREPFQTTMTTSVEVTYATTAATLQMGAEYFANPPDGDGNYEFTVTVSRNADFSSPLYERQWTEENYPVGANLVIDNETITLDGGAPWTGTLYIKIDLLAEDQNGGTSDNKYSSPQVRVNSVQIWADNETELTEVDLVTPYTAEDLPDVHYVQSPYGNPDGFKEMVFTHPQHPPQRLYFDPGLPGYVWEAIPFVDEDDTPNAPSAWAVNNYPATCTSYHGRLILAGGQTFKVKAGDPVASVSETVWGTEVGKWDTFSRDIDVNPDDSIEFTAVYRSPIQWAFGGKSLLIGSLEYEYSASGEGIFSPGDLGVFLHTTHGSANIQPAAFGDQVLFPADAGTKLRSFTYSNQDQSWVAQDLTVWHPEICYPKIKRMARVRNPHQQCWVLITDGHVAIYNAEGSLQGWNTFKLTGGRVKDMCVITDADGRDVPMLAVERDINGTRVLYLEAIANYVDTARWDYTGSSKIYSFPTADGSDTITELDHLEGKNVQVYDQYRFVGKWRVEGGQIVMNDDAGGTTKLRFCVVGLIHQATLRTLPPQKEDPGGASNFTNVTVRILGGTMPLINGIRPEERDPRDVMNLSPANNIVRDSKEYTGGWTHEANPVGAMILTITEHIPFPTQILGIFAKVKGNSL